MILERKLVNRKHLLEGFKGSLRLVISAFNYMNKLKKEVVPFSVNDTVLAELCTWHCEVGTDKLFPFGVVKHVMKCTRLKN